MEELLSMRCCLKAWYGGMVCKSVDDNRVARFISSASVHAKEREKEKKKAGTGTRKKKCEGKKKKNVEQQCVFVCCRVQNEYAKWTSCN